MTDPTETDEESGPRALALRRIYSEALTHTLKTLSYARFAQCFPTPARYCPESLRGLWDQMVKKLEGAAQSEFEDILRERAVVHALNELDQLVAEAQRRKAEAPPGEIPVAPHTLPPTSLLAAHLAPHLTQTRSQLNARLQTVQSQNAQLAAQIQEQRTEVDGLVGGLEAFVRDLEGAVGEVGRAVGAGDAHAEGEMDMREEVRGLDRELGSGGGV
ncbi:MAG: hypothetical protein M1817_002717 [Caeruleum heppii]|nr:MAG: hypothetical protein M1817_002717 [Caeruleum heppii]